MLAWSKLRAYTNDVVLMAMSINALKDIFQELDAETCKIMLIVKRSKAKYMNVSAFEQRRSVQGIEVGVFVFQGVTEFIYQRATLNNDNKNSSEIQS